MASGLFHDDWIFFSTIHLLGDPVIYPLSLIISLPKRLDVLTYPTQSRTQCLMSATKKNHVCIKHQHSEWHLRFQEGSVHVSKFLFYLFVSDGKFMCGRLLAIAAMQAYVSRTSFVNFLIPCRQRINPFRNYHVKLGRTCIWRLPDCSTETTRR